MSDWYTFSVLALFFMGAQRFLYKVSAERRCNTAWTTFSFMATVAILSSTLFIAFKTPVTNIQFLIFIGLLNSAAFVVATITHIESLKHLPTSVVYPIIRLNTVIIILFSIFYFKDHLSFYQILGILLAMGVMVILTRELDERETVPGNIKRGLLLVLISAFAGAIASISSKFAALHTNRMAFIAISYIASMLFSFGLRGKMQTEEVSGNLRDALVIGFVMGLFNFAGYYSFLRALSAGPLSIVATVTGMAFVIAIVLSALVYKEKLTILKILGISLTMISMILLRL